MKHKFLFLVGSAINHFQEEHFSNFSSKERFDQTLETIKSIKEKVPNSYIIIYEASEFDIDLNYESILTDNCDQFIKCNDDPIIKILYENLHRDPNKFTYVKSMLECRCLQIVLSYLIQTNNFNDVSRIFKISGRYKLNDNFSIKDYYSNFLINKYVMKCYDYQERFLDPNNLYADLYGCKGNIVTGLWSFDKFLFNDISIVLDKSFKYMEQAIQFTAGIDIEHSFYHFIDKNKILNVPVLGLDIIKGMDGDSYSL